MKLKPLKLLMSPIYRGAFIGLMIFNNLNLMNLEASDISVEEKPSRNIQDSNSSVVLDLWKKNETGLPKLIHLNNFHEHEKYIEAKFEFKKHFKLYGKLDLLADIYVDPDYKSKKIYKSFNPSVDIGFKIEPHPLIFINVGITSVVAILTPNKFSSELAHKVVSFSNWASKSYDVKDVYFAYMGLKLSKAFLEVNTNDIVIQYGPDNDAFNVLRYQAQFQFGIIDAGKLIYGGAFPYSTGFSNDRGVYNLNTNPSDVLVGISVRTILLFQNKNHLLGKETTNPETINLVVSYWNGINVDSLLQRADASFSGMAPHRIFKLGFYYSQKPYDTSAGSVLDMYQAEFDPFITDNFFNMAINGTLEYNYEINVRDIDLGSKYQFVSDEASTLAYHTQNNPQYKYDASNSSARNLKNLYVKDLVQQGLELAFRYSVFSSYITVILGIHAPRKDSAKLTLSRALQLDFAVHAIEKYLILNLRLKLAKNPMLFMDNKDQETENMAAYLALNFFPLSSRYFSLRPEFYFIQDIHNFDQKPVIGFSMRLSYNFR